MDLPTYQSELASALAELRLIADHAAINGDGAAQFLSAERGARGVELYRGPNRVVIDRSMNGELLGEQAFDSLAVAVEVAAQWLNGVGE